MYLVAEQLDGQRDLEQLAAALTVEFGRAITAEQVSFLVENKLRPAGIAAVAGVVPGGAGSAVAAPRRPDALLALRYRLPVVPARVSWVIAAVFRPFYWPPVLVLALTAFVGLDVAVVVRGGVAQILPSAQALVAQPALTLLVFGLVLASGMFHECGHVTACRYGGARPGVMGLGIYLVWPAMYSTVTDAYRLSRGGRLRTDLGGIYFNVVSIAGMSLAYLCTGAPWLLVAIVVLHVETAWQFLPSIRLDGYYILADVIGVPDLFSYLRPVLRSLVPGRAAHPRVAELKPWTRRVISLWVAGVIPVLLFFLVNFLILAPRILPVVAHSLLALLDAIAAAVATGQPARAALGMVQVVLLLLPWAGIAMVAVGWSRTFGRLALARRRKARTAGGAEAPAEHRASS
ncbi:hypothetical protein [Pseudonocardia acidicola]|uniref:hypothetical protein n=1 Tax=Pseudonocardia acidicola TaxID=2724939 RepID=UPI001B7CFB1F|nr:hypothetical protein [Pseudonocardia acidicola]